VQVGVERCYDGDGSSCDGAQAYDGGSSFDGAQAYGDVSSFDGGSCVGAQAYVGGSSCGVFGGVAQACVGASQFGGVE
jgi:hypothetical protein